MVTNPSTPAKKEAADPYLAKWEILFEKTQSHWMVIPAEEGQRVYPCYACRDMFGSKTSFMDHVNRISIALKYRCQPCGSQLNYYNPCSLLLHARDHFTPSGGEIDMDDITIDILPAGYGGFPPHPDIPMLFDVEEDETDDPSLNSKFYSPVRLQSRQRKVPMMATVLLFINAKLMSDSCPKMVLKQTSSTVPRCVFVVTDLNLSNQVPEVKSQFIQYDFAKTQADVHGDCDVVTINGDQLNSEQITFIHSRSESTRSDNIKIVHTEITSPNVVSKKDSRRCSECQKHQELPMATHFTNFQTPFDDDLLCTMCNYIAASQCSFKAHVRLHHGRAPFVCPECGRDFESIRELLLHLDELCFHISKQVRMRCSKMNCCKIFAHLPTFTHHFATHMQKMNKCSSCLVYLTADLDFEAHVEMTHRKDEDAEPIGLFQCSVCGDSDISEENYQEHLEVHSYKNTARIYVYVCKFCRNYFRTTVTYSVHLARCPKRNNQEDFNKIKKSSPVTYCPVCKFSVRLFMLVKNCPNCNQSHEELLRANPLNNTSLKKVKCILCKQDVFTGTEHLCKYMNPAVELLDVTTNLEEIKNELLNSPNWSNERIPKRRRKKTTSPGLSKLRKLLSKTENVELPRPFDGTYTCNICSFLSEDRSVFHKHIVVHRDISTEFQCMECGECFVVKPSFQKHLAYFHQMLDVERYIKENDCVDETAIKELETQTRLGTVINGLSSEPVGENQCRICREQFGDKLELTKHFRVHGMAFLLNNTKSQS